MIPCLFNGDSIGVGSHYEFKQCKLQAHVGWSSVRWNKHYPKDQKAHTVVISLGSNDWEDTNALEEIRARTEAEEVIWIVPHRNAKKVLDLAARYGDRVVSFKAGSDHIHPKGFNYHPIANSLKSLSPTLRNLK